MKSQIHFAYTSLVEIVADAAPNVLVEELLCNKVFFPIHNAAPLILNSVKLPDIAGMYQAWVTGCVVDQGEGNHRVDVAFSDVAIAPPECLQALYALAKEQQEVVGPKIEVFTDADIAAIAGRVH